tara:strand:- start:608 stop:808 length:201 start_codon:yes stop_codon:yes gene_type:complete
MISNKKSISSGNNSKLIFESSPCLYKPGFLHKNLDEIIIIKSNENTKSGLSKLIKPLIRITKEGTR